MIKEEKKELINEIVKIVEGLSIGDAKYILGHAQGIESKKIIQTLDN